MKKVNGYFKGISLWNISKNFSLKKKKFTAFYISFKSYVKFFLRLFIDNYPKDIC